MVMRECSQCIWAVRGDQRSQGHGCSFTAMGLNNLGFPRCQGQSWNFLNISFSNSHVDSVRCSFSNRFQPEEAVSLCFVSLAAVLDHLQIMGHTSKELQLFCSQRLQQHPKRCLDQLLIWPAQNLPWVSSKMLFGSPGALLSEGWFQNVWLKMRGDFCPGAMVAECRWELTRKVSVSTSTVHNWEVEVEQRIVNYIP